MLFGTFPKIHPFWKGSTSLRDNLVYHILKIFKKLPSWVDNDPSKVFVQTTQASGESTGDLDLQYLKLFAQVALL